MPSQRTCWLLLLILVTSGRCTTSARSRRLFQAPQSEFQKRHGACPRYDPIYAQVHKDLAAWGLLGINAAVAPNISKLCPPTTRLPCYLTTILVENGTVYLTSQIKRGDGAHGDAALLTGFLLELYEASLLGHLPDSEFAIYTGDEFSVHRLAAEYAPPNTDPFLVPHSSMPIVLMFSKISGEPGVLMPFSAHQRCFQDNIDHLIGNPASMPAVPWAARKPVAFGRWTLFCANWQAGKKWPSTGTSTGCARELLLPVGVAHPELLDVGTGPEARRPFADHTLYKYAVSNDGWSASSRLEKVMLTGSTVLKQTSPRIGYFYHLLREYEHFVPYWRDNNSDIVQSVRWLQTHDEEAQLIAASAGAFVRKNLGRKSRLCYWRHLVGGIGRHMRYKPVPCAERPICVTALAELSFMGHYVACSPYETVHQQLNLMHGNRTLDHGVKIGTRWGLASGVHIP